MGLEFVRSKKQLRRGARNGLEKAATKAKEMHKSLKEDTEKIFQNVHEAVDEVKSTLSATALTLDDLGLGGTERQEQQESKQEAAATPPPRQEEEVQTRGFKEDHQHTPPTPKHALKAERGLNRREGREKQKKKEVSKGRKSSPKPPERKPSNDKSKVKTEGDQQPASLLFSQQPSRTPEEDERVFKEYPTKAEISAALAAAEAKKASSSKDMVSNLLGGNGGPLLGKHASRKEGILGKYRQQQSVQSSSTKQQGSGAVDDDFSGIPWMFLTVMIGVYLSVRFFDRRIREWHYPTAAAAAAPSSSNPRTSSTKPNTTTRAIAAGEGAQEDMMEPPPVQQETKNAIGDEDDQCPFKDFDVISESDVTEGKDDDDAHGDLPRRAIKNTTAAFPQHSPTTICSSSSVSSSTSAATKPLAEEQNSKRNKNGGEISARGTCSQIAQLPLRVKEACKSENVKCPFLDVYDETDETLLAFLAFLEQRKASRGVGERDVSNY